MFRGNCSVSRLGLESQTFYGIMSSLIKICERRKREKEGRGSETGAPVGGDTGLSSRRRLWRKNVPWLLGCVHSAFIDLLSIVYYHQLVQFLSFVPCARNYVSRLVGVVWTLIVICWWITGVVLSQWRVKEHLLPSDVFCFIPFLDHITSWTVSFRER